MPYGLKKSFRWPCICSRLHLFLSLTLLFYPSWPGTSGYLLPRLASVRGSVPGYCCPPRYRPWRSRACVAKRAAVVQPFSDLSLFLRLYTDQVLFDMEASPPIVAIVAGALSCLWLPRTTTSMVISARVRRKLIDSPSQTQRLRLSRCLIESGIRGFHISMPTQSPAQLHRCLVLRCSTYFPGFLSMSHCSGYPLRNSGPSHSHQSLLRHVAHARPTPSVIPHTSSTCRASVCVPHRHQQGSIVPRNVLASPKPPQLSEDSPFVTCNAGADSRGHRFLLMTYQLLLRTCHRTARSVNEVLTRPSGKNLSARVHCIR